MIKSLLTMLLAVILLISVTFIEQQSVQKSFQEFNEILLVTQTKLQSQNASSLDTQSLEKFWLSKKHKLHVWIPHGEIKEIDLWVSECVAYTKLKKFDEAIAKIDVLKILAEEIPKNFSLHLENLF